MTIDDTGDVVDVEVLRSQNERINDSAISRINKWKFTPVLRNGVAVSAKGIVSFHFDTREFGPKRILTDAEARALATHIIAPNLKGKTFPSGDAEMVDIAVGNQGKLIAAIGMPSPVQIAHTATSASIKCYEALKHWHFRPLMRMANRGHGARTCCFN